MSATPKSRLHGALHRIESEGSWLVVVLLFGPVSLFAEALIERTHHRPLGAATFASVLILLWIIVDLVTKRQLNSTRARVGRFTGATGALLSVIVLCRGFL